MRRSDLSMGSYTCTVSFAEASFSRMSNVYKCLGGAFKNSNVLEQADKQQGITT